MTDPVRVAVLDDYTGSALASADWGALAGRCTVDVYSDTPLDRAALVTRLRPYEVLVAIRERTPFSRDLINALPRLRLLVTLGKVNRAIDLDAATEAGVLVCGTSSSSRESTAELTWGLILALTRQVVRDDRAMRRGLWQTGLATELGGKTLGVVGLGTLGSAVARVGLAFGMQVLAWSPRLTDEKAIAAGARLVDKDALLREADVVTLHLVLGPTTRGIIGRDALALMKPTAYLVNTSRGPLIDRDALVDALRAGEIAGAGLDVYDEEPLPADDPLRSLPNTVLSPHMGFVTAENYRAHFPNVVADIAAWLDGSPINPIKTLAAGQARSAGA